MKGSSQFKQTIQDYLVRRAESDELFAANYLKADKNIDDCITYVINEVHKSGCNGFPDEEIFSMAVHYYDEENVEVGKPINCQIVVNHTVELTEEEKNQVLFGILKHS